MIAVRELDGPELIALLYDLEHGLAKNIFKGLEVNWVTVDLSKRSGHDPVSLRLDYAHFCLLQRWLEKHDFFTRQDHP